MTAVATDQLTETIGQLKQSAEFALSAESVQDFVDLEKFVNEVEAYVRETQQAMWVSEATRTIKNLEKGNPLTPEDLDAIRTFLISDAEHYLKHENNYGDWKRELGRLMDDLVKRCNMIDRESVGDMRGVLADAIRLVPDIRSYLEQRERVDKLSTALDTLDEQSCTMLAKLMREQLEHLTHRPSAL